MTDTIEERNARLVAAFEEVRRHEGADSPEDIIMRDRALSYIFREWRRLSND